MTPLKNFTEIFHWKVSLKNLRGLPSPLNLTRHEFTTIFSQNCTVADISSWRFQAFMCCFPWELDSHNVCFALSMDLKGILSIFWCLQFVETSFPDFAPKVCSSSGSPELRSLTQQPNKTWQFLLEIHPLYATPTSYNPIFNSALCVLLSTL